MAKLALAFVGAAVGFLIGGPVGAEVGFSIGGILGSALFPGKLPPGPRVNDLVVTSATNGAPIPIVYGTQRIAGNIIWAPPIKETSSNVSVKGGPRQLQFSYTASFAVAFCEGPATIGRVWFDSKVVYDPANGSAAITAIQESGSFFGGYQTVLVTSTLNPNIGDEVTIAGAPAGYNGSFQVVTSSPVNFTYANPTSGLAPGSGGTASVPAPVYSAPTIYYGIESQNADPTIQAAVGAAACPAFRGICYAVWSNFPLANFGNRIPNVRAEISGYVDTKGTTVTPAFVQVKANTVGNTGQNSAVFSSNNTKGNTIIVEFVVNSFNNVGQSDPGAILSVTDTLGNVYTQLGGTNGHSLYSYYTGNQHGYNSAVFIAQNVKPGPNTVQANIIGYNGSGAGTVTGSVLTALEYVGNGGLANPVVSIASVASTGGPYPDPFGPSVGTTQPGQLVLWLSGLGNNSGASPAGSTNRATGINEWTIAQPITQSYTMPLVNDQSVYAWVLVLSNAPAFPGVLTSFTTESIIQDICTRSGLQTTDIDTSPMNVLPGSSPVVPVPTPGGYTITRPTSGQAALKPLAQAFFFDGVESGGVIRFVPRGGTTATLTIPENDLGLQKDSKKLTEQFGMEQDLPREIDVIFNDKALDYQQNKGQKRRHTKIVKTKQQTVIELPMVLDSTTAREISEKALFLAYLERHPFDINLWKALYMLFDPTDVIQFTYEGLNFIARIVKLDIGVDFSVQISGVNENASAYLSTIPGSSGSGVVIAHGKTLPDTTLFLLDIPLLRDSDSNTAGSGYYFAMGSVAPLSWPGAILEKSSDNVNFAQESSSSVAMQYGTATTILGVIQRSRWTWDMNNSMTIAMTNGTLAGSTDAAVLNGANALLVGNEVIQFVNCVQLPNGSYVISRLLRGRRGTDTSCNSHVANEAVIVLAAGVVHMPTSLSNLQVLRYFRPVTYGGNIATVTSKLFTDTGNDLRPYAPAQLTGTRDGSNNLTLSWVRRTRLGGDWLEGIGVVPLSESTESYDVEILSGSPLAVVRTFAGLTSPTVVYSAAQQITDFGAVQSLVIWNVYQNSSAIGRGFKATASV